MRKLVNYAAIKMQGYAVYSLTCGLDNETRNQIIENNSVRFNSDDEIQVFRNTVLYPFDSMLYTRLMTLRDNSLTSLSEKLSVDEKIIREKSQEYINNDFDKFLTEFGIKFDFSSEKGAKK